MNTHEHETGRDDFPDALRWRLRGLRREIEPGHDLWDGIAARIATTPQASPRKPGLLRRMPGMFATAAVLVLAVGLGWQLRPDTPQAVEFSAPSPLLVAADAMTREYEGALREIEAMLEPDAAAAPLSELDASAATVRAALMQAPDSRFLLERLQRIYAQRLSLTQRLANA
jgi:hypothetical protein